MESFNEKLHYFGIPTRQEIIFFSCHGSLCETLNWRIGEQTRGCWLNWFNETFSIWSSGVILKASTLHYVNVRRSYKFPLLFTIHTVPYTIFRNLIFHASAASAWSHANRKNDAQETKWINWDSVLSVSYGRKEYESSKIGLFAWPRFQQIFNLNFKYHDNF